MLALALKFWPYIAAGVAALLLIGYIATLKLEVSHYKSAATVSEQKYQDEYKQHAADVMTWTADVARLKASNTKLADMYNKAISDANEKYNKLSKYQDQQNKDIVDAISKAFKPGDVVSTPAGFGQLYNSAVASANIAVNGQAGSQEANKAGGPGDAGIRQTFDAPSFAQVTVGNVIEYGKLAARCNALVDIIKGTINGTDPSGAVGTSSNDGGNLSSGTPASE